MLLATALVLELVRESLTGTHCRYREFVDGLPTDNYVTQPCDLAKSSEDLGAVKPATSLRRVDGRVVRRVIRSSSPHEPYAHDYDASTGELLRRVPLFYRAKPGRVFDPNPVVTLNDPTLQDRNDSASAVPERAYRHVEIEANPTGPLSGAYVSLIDSQARTVPPPDGSAKLEFNREEDGFEDVNAYFHIDRNQRYLHSLGFTGERGVAAYPVPVDAHAASGADNSFFVPSALEAGRGTLFFGEGGTDDAEDADIVIHEYTHAIHEWIAPGTFGGALAGEPRALAEGMADYWAYSTHAAARRASGRDPFCFADWDARCALDDASERCAYAADANCLRRVDSASTLADYVREEIANVEHRNGAIWSSALREIHDRIGKRETDTILIESLFGAPPRPTFAVMARRLLEADRLLYQGTYAGAICSAMFTRGILVECDFTPRGELTLFQSDERGVPIPENTPAGITSVVTVDDTRAIERVYVRVDIAHPSRGDLRVELTAPDGTAVLLHQISSVRTADIHETFGLTAAPLESLDILRGRAAAGEWRLNVADRRPLDIGTLLSWSLVIQFAGDEPLAKRPRDSSSQMIPVVTQVFGEQGKWMSDVRLANPHGAQRNATLIFTRSGEDGFERFAAIQIALASGQTVSFEDVVGSVFMTAGSGSLEVLGDVLVMSRTYLQTERGTLGQQVPPNLDKAPAGVPLSMAPVTSVVAGDWRLNLGVTETAGGEGLIVVTQLPSGRSYSFPILPFSHVQIPIAPADGVLDVHVVRSSAVISAYLSQIDQQSGDSIFVPAERRSMGERSVIAPVISSNGWRTDLRLVRVQPSSTVQGTLLSGTFAEAKILNERMTSTTLFFPDVVESFLSAPPLAALHLRMTDGVAAAARIYRDQVSQYVPFLDAAGPDEQHLLFIENTAGYRTNIGIVSERAAAAEVIVYDSAGDEIQREMLATAGGIAQTRVTSPRAVGARAIVRFLAGTGRAYASLVDNGTSDATFVAGQESCILRPQCP